MVNVELSCGQVGTLGDYEYVKPSSWLRCLDQEQLLQLICGTRLIADLGPTLTTFWGRYEKLHPNHQIFQKARDGLLRLDSTLPWYLHADEGRTLKKKAVFMVQWQMAFGTGASKHNTPEIIQARMKEGKLQPNCKRDSMATRFLCGMLLRADYVEAPGNLDDLLQLICEDLQMLGDEGLAIQGGHRVWVCVLGNKGDWDYLAKSAHLTRSYRNAPKHATMNAVNKPMCHLCMAGSPGCPYEDVCLGVKRME